MNVLSQALKARHYPKTMIVSRDQARDIIGDFYTEFRPSPSTFFDLNKYAAYFEAYYNTYKGRPKKCLILMEK